MNRDAIPMRETCLIAMILTSATILCLKDPSIIPTYFMLLTTLVGGILGYATQAAKMRNDEEKQR